MKLVVFPDLLKGRVNSYTKKDGTFVRAHDNGRQAAAPRATKRSAPSANPKAGGYNVAPFKHGGFQIKEPDGKNHIILRDKGFADAHASALNHVAGSGNDASMDSAIHAAAQKHLFLSSFDEVGRDSEDFHDTGKAGLKDALTDAYNAGAGHTKGGAHRAATVAAAAKHLAGFDSLDADGRDGADFKEVGKGQLKHALKHAYAAGASRNAG